MEQFALFQQILHLVNGYVWGPAMVVLLVGAHLFFTVRLRGIQRYLPLAFKVSRRDDGDAKGDISHAQSLKIALATTLSFGAIVGVATAIAVGGPGAVFWIVITGVFGIATKYSESLLAIKYRIRTRKGHRLGGSMYTIDHGMNQKWLGQTMGVVALVTAFLAGNIIFANSLTESIHEMLEINTWIVAVCLAVPTIIIVVGGIKHIANACSVLVPWMVGIFMFCAMCILIRNGSFIIPAIKLICVSAFSFHAVGGGFVGAGVLMALKLGVTRGQSPIDAGLGASAIIASSTRTEDPVRQALVSSMSTFWDSVVACSITGLVIVTSIMKSPDKLAGLSGERLTHAVFNELPGIGGFFYPIILFLFFYTAILGWSLIGERSVEYLFGRKGVPTFRYFWILAVVFGSMLKSPDESDVPGFFLELSYLALGLMTVLNLVPTLFLHKVVVSETRKYLWDRIDDPQAYADPPDQQKIPQETEKKPNRASHSEEFGNHSH